VTATFDNSPSAVNRPRRAGGVQGAFGVADAMGSAHPGHHHRDEQAARTREPGRCGPDGRGGRERCGSQIGSQDHGRPMRHRRTGECLVTTTRTIGADHSRCDETPRDSRDAARSIRDEEVAGSNPVTPTQTRGPFPSGRGPLLVPVQQRSTAVVILRAVGQSTLPIPRMRRVGTTRGREHIAERPFTPPRR